MDIFLEISLILVIAAGISIVMRLLKQPLVVGYILTGVIVGPSVLDVFRSQHEIELFSKIGITVLLFIVGLHMSPRVVKELGSVSLITGIGQILITSTIGFCIALFLGIPRMAALYIAIALTFSSTIIVIKLLSDKRDLNKLYGKIAIGFLLVQDIVATIILIVVSTVSSDQAAAGSAVSAVAWALLKGVILIVVLLTSSSYILPRVARYLAKSQELLFFVSLAWGMGLASLFQMIGFSVEIGALVAGVCLASTPFAYEIGSRMKPLRDFFVVLFFVLLGANMQVSNVGPLIIPTLVLSAFVLVGNPIVIVMLMNWFGYGRRTGFMAALAVAQISEFSLILASLGFAVGHISRDVLSIITMVGLITIAGSSYMIIYSEKLYHFVEPYLRFLELRKSLKGKDREKREYAAVLFGFGRIGQDFLKAFQDMKKKFIVVDFDPNIIEKLERMNIPSQFGDASDPEFLQELNLQDLQLAVTTTPDLSENLLLIEQVRIVNKKAIVIAMARDDAEARELYNKGATYVVIPHYLGARYATSMISKHGLSKKEYEEERGRHLTHLYRRERQNT